MGKWTWNARWWFLQKFIYFWPEGLWNSAEEQNISCINLGRYLQEKWNFLICVITMGQANYEHFSSRFPWQGVLWSETSPSSASSWNVKLRVVNTVNRPAGMDCKGISELPQIQLILPYKISCNIASLEIPLLSRPAGTMRIMIRL